MLSGTSLAFLSVHLISILVMVFFTVLVFLHDRKNLLNISFAVLMITSIGWASANIFTFNVSQYNFEKALNVAIFFASLQNLIIPVFVYLFPKPSFSLKFWQKALFVIFAVSFTLLSQFIFIIDPEVTFVGTHIPATQPSALNPIWGIGLLSLITFSIFVAISKFRRADNEGRGQLASIIAGIVTTSALLFISQYLTVNVLQNPALNSYGPLFMMPLIVGTSYAIVRYRLFNIKAITTEIVTFALWLFLLLRVLLDESAQDRFIDSALLIGIIVTGIFLIKSVLNEVSQREQLERVSNDLRDLKVNLEAKVVVQTQEIKRAYEVEKKARIELEELDEAKDQFILATQHHLRTPLTIIKGYLSVLREKFSLTKEVLGTVSEMQESAESMSRSVNDLLQATEVSVREKL